MQAWEDQQRSGQRRHGHGGRRGRGGGRGRSQGRQRWGRGGEGSSHHGRQGDGAGYGGHAPHLLQQQQQPETQDPQMQAYIRRWRALVDLEQKKEQEMVRERLASWSLDRLCREGLVLMGVTLSQHGSFFGKLVLRVRPQQRGFLPFNRFSTGDLVTICRQNPLTERAFEATVMERGRGELRLVCDARPPGMDQGTWRLDQGANTVVYDRMRAAIAALAKDPAGTRAGRDAEQQAEDSFASGSSRGHSGSKRRKKGGRHDEEEEEPSGPQGTWLSHALLHAGQGCDLTATDAGLTDHQAVALLSALEQPEVPPSAGVQSSPASRLNQSQRQAVVLAARHRLALLQGPPGTGKTTTIVKYIHLLKNELKVRHSILACAQSNVAVDNLLEGLMDCGVRAVRVGQPVKVRAALRESCLDSRLERHPLFAEVEQDRRQLQEFRRNLPNMRGRDRGLGHRDASRMAVDLRRKREQMMEEVLHGAEVICSTCVGAGSDMLEGMTFGVVILDEGSQCSEPESLIPLVKGSRHVVLVGDHHQLPPTVMSEQAAEQGMALSLFERLIQGSVPSAMLQVQYRMHPSIAHFPNQQFYSGRVGNGPQQRPLPPLPFPSRDHHVVFVESHGTEEVSHGGSKLNRKEAQLVQRIVSRLLRSGVASTAIGVITPYSAQLQVLSDMLSSSMSTNADGQDDGLEIKTVDGYQGREKDIIIFSTVRSNAHGQVGFLQDWRRMNVALTRARQGLVVLGSPQTLRTSAHWASYMQWIEQHNLLLPESAF